MFCDYAFGASSSRDTKPSRTLGKSRRLRIEPLESRMLLAADFLAAAEWVDQGPGTILGGNNVEIPALSNPQAGAVNAVATDPTNANRMFIGSVGGGIWRTRTGRHSRISLHPQRSVRSLSALWTRRSIRCSPARDAIAVAVGMALQRLEC
jgi:hypothetical protein